MYMIVFLYIAIFLLIRAIAAYDPHQLVPGHRKISNPSVARFLLSQNDLMHTQTKAPKTNRTNITYLGMGFYLLFALVLTLNAVLFFSGSLGDDYQVWNTRYLYLATTTINDSLIFYSTLMLLGWVFGAHLLNLAFLAMRRPNINARKFLVGAFFVCAIVGHVFFIFNLTQAIALIQLI